MPVAQGYFDGYLVGGMPRIPSGRWCSCKASPVDGVTRLFGSLRRLSCGKQSRLSISDIPSASKRDQDITEMQVIDHLVASNSVAQHGRIDVARIARALDPQRRKRIAISSFASA
jgi:hypothetical protein